jgi:hypothetical protein
METTMVGCWSFWIHRMRANFENQNISWYLLQVLKESFELVMHKARPNLKEGMS